MQTDGLKIPSGREGSLEAGGGRDARREQRNAAERSPAACLLDGGLALALPNQSRAAQLCTIRRIIARLPRFATLCGVRSASRRLFASAHAQQPCSVRHGGLVIIHDSLV